MTEILRVDPQLTLQSFMNDFCKKVHNICQEKCQIMDTKASFPSLQLYRIDEIKVRFENRNVISKKRKEKTNLRVNVLQVNF